MIVDGYIVLWDKRITMKRWMIYVEDYMAYTRQENIGNIFHIKN